MTYNTRRITGAGDIWVAEMTVSYDGGAPRYGVDVLEIRKGKIVHETVYVGEAFEVPERRAHSRVAAVSDPQSGNRDPRSHSCRSWLALRLRRRPHTDGYLLTRANEMGAADRRRTCR